MQRAAQPGKVSDEASSNHEEYSWSRLPSSPEADTGATYTLSSGADILAKLDVVRAPESSRGEWIVVYESLSEEAPASRFEDELGVSTHDLPNNVFSSREKAEEYIRIITGEELDYDSLEGLLEEYGAVKGRTRTGAGPGVRQTEAETSRRITSGGIDETAFYARDGKIFARDGIFGREEEIGDPDQVSAEKLIERAVEEGWNPEQIRARLEGSLPAGSD